MSGRKPDVQRRLRHGPILPAQVERQRWLSVPLIRRIGEMDVPLWAGDLVCAYLLAHLLWAWA